MVARVIPKSVSMVAQTAPPTSVTVRAGYNRRFFLTAIRQTPGTPTAPTLGGQSNDQTETFSYGGMRFDTWIWEETTLQTAGLSINTAGALTVAGFAETGSPTEYIWSWGTVKDSDQSASVFEQPAIYSAVSSLVIPSVLAADLVPAGRGLLTFVVMEPATATMDNRTLDDSLILNGPVTQTSYVAYLLESVEGDKARFTHPLTGMTGDMIASLMAFPSAVPISGSLPIHAPRIRSMDAKTIADRYNMGVPKQEDYIFGSGRKFYQSDQN